MSGIFSTLNTANKGLIAQQTALHTTAHNISNANTDGYSRQRVDLKADLAYNFAGVGQLGTGVKMESIVRMVDDYVNKQIRQENGTLQSFAAKSEILEQLEIIFNEPSDTGINFNLGEMFDAWQELSKNPESLNSKTIVVEKSRTLAETLNQMANQINNLQENTIADIEKNVLDFNSIVNKLETLNKQIFNISVKGQIPNDLLDQRDLLLKDLSSLVDFEADFSDKFGRVGISINGKDLLLGDADYEMSMISNKTVNVDGTYTITVSRGGGSLEDYIFDGTDGTIDITDITKIKTGDVILSNKTLIDGKLSILVPTIASGQIKGKSEGLKDLKDMLADLNKFVDMMAKNINLAHVNDGDGEPIFVTYDSDGKIIVDVDGNAIINSAGSIEINRNILVNNSLIMAGAKDDSPEGDGSRALEIARLRNAKIGGTTIEGAYRDIVTKIGISKEHADNMVSNQEILMQQLVIRRESTSGVSIDEEVSNLIKYQKSFDANAKVIAILTDMLDTLINRMGV